jgi:alpha-glucosidase
MTWWKQGVIYQIYPRSFADANGDGIGDLRGIIGKLDYLQDLGVDALWLSPCYPSPMADFGYDVSDYCDIHPDFGTLADFDALVAAAKARQLHVILDFVPNHSSDQHPWFAESRSSRTNPKRDWYVWRDAKPDGTPPNNWQSMFGGSAWQWDAHTGQYYLHSFLAEQPDLNWRNAELAEQMLEVLRFWMRRGVSGFRIDVVDFIMKDPQERDNPRNPHYKEGDYVWEEFINTHNFGHPDLHAMMHRINRTLYAFPDAVAIGEANYLLGPKETAAYMGTADAPEMDAPFNFRFMGLMRPESLSVAALRAHVEEYEAVLPPHTIGNYVLGNHDTPRVASRIGKPAARLAALLTLTLRGLPFIYYGEEIGMTDVPIPFDQQQDPFGIRVPGRGRDPERTPMQWDDQPHGGFAAPDAAAPWLPLAADYATVNVAAQMSDPTSFLSMYRRLLALRRATPSLHSGSYASVSLGANDAQVYAYLRQHDGHTYLIAANFSDSARHVDASAALGAASAQVIFSTAAPRDEASDIRALALAAHEGVIVRVG